MMSQRRAWLQACLVLIALVITSHAVPTNYDYSILPNIARHSPPLSEKRDAPQFQLGEPIDGNGKGAPIFGGTNKPLDVQNPSNLGEQATDNGVVANLKWSFSQSKARITNGGWSREQVVQDLPQSHDVAAAQQHLRRGAIRELHWHRTAEWGFV